jgi:hypothetical protein
MKTTLHPYRRHAVTRTDIIGIVAAAAGILFILGIALPAYFHSKARDRRISCLCNLKQVGLAFRMWSNDHADSFPWKVSDKDGGTLEIVSSGEAFRHFQAVSNELVSPKMLVCPSDETRRRVTTWEDVNNRSLSYFVGLNADEARPQTILSGDRNISGGKDAGGNTMEFDLHVGTWGNEIHRRLGNLGLGDGSAIMTSPESLRVQLDRDQMSYTNGPTRLEIP